jgi:superfamily II DNA or RNA helicase/HKD family nuclease
MNLNKLAKGFNLITGGADDPLLPKLIQAINNATHIDISVSFILTSGLELLFDPLKEAIDKNAEIRILTSDYLYITQPKALKELLLLCESGAKIRIFTCSENVSFHMKSYIFVKTQNENIIEGCAFVGSNNISRQALTKGHEWCLRHDWELPENSNKALEFQYIKNQFENIFFHPQTIDLSDDWLDIYRQNYEKYNPKNLFKLKGSSFDEPEPFFPPAEIQEDNPGWQKKNKTQNLLRFVNNDFDEDLEYIPTSVQEEALKALSQTRIEGYKRGLVIMATGMGKTWLSAFDCNQMKANKVLFIAHRQEILIQAQRTFIKLNPEARTGLYNGASKAKNCDFVFASIQTIGKINHLENFEKDYFDYIIVDEFHHASAKSYKKLLGYFNPKFLLGLTATPERTDQSDILSLCDNNIVFESNLVEGISENFLVPFNYYGIFDKYVNYQEIPWRNGKFNPEALDNAFATKKRAQHIFHNWNKYKQKCTLGFCVSKKHADFMADYFISKGVNAASVHSSSDLRRNEGLRKLENNEVDILFTVDLFNEGVDVPIIDTILMIRPTESKILFLQQLGRGLRKSEQTGKNKLVVVDFIGNHKSFLNKPSALLNADGNKKKIITKISEIKNLPKGCFINFDPELINFWNELKNTLVSSPDEKYLELESELGHRPTASEFFLSGYSLYKLRQKYESWFHLVAFMESDKNLESLINKYKNFIIQGVEKTKLTKSYKAVLLKAFLELDGLEKEIAVSELCQKSFDILHRRPDLVEKDLPDYLKTLSADDPKWQKYWLKNPINFYCKKDQNNEKAWFKLEDNKFFLNMEIEKKDRENLLEILNELIDLKITQYLKRS